MATSVATEPSVVKISLKSATPTRTSTPVRTSTVTRKSASAGETSTMRVSLGTANKRKQAAHRKKQRWNTRIAATAAAVIMVLSSCFNIYHLTRSNNPIGGHYYQPGVSGLMLTTGVTNENFVRDLSVKHNTQDVINLNAYETLDDQMELFGNSVKYEYEYIQDGHDLPYAVAAPTEDGKSLTDQALPLIVWLHDSVDVGNMEHQFMDSGLFSAIKKADMINFRSYILAPHLDKNSELNCWNRNKSAKFVSDILTDFVQTHNVDPNNIVVMGEGIGGAGALYLANHFNGQVFPNWFSKCVVFSAQNPQRSTEDPVDVASIQIPIRGYVGSFVSGDNYAAPKYMLSDLAAIVGHENIITVSSKKTHTCEVVMQMDENKNLRPDVIEWCFDENGDGHLDNHSQMTRGTASISATSLTDENNDSVYNSVPLYFQTDYPDVPYSGGTLADSGCGITCMAMVASYMLDKEYTPDELARYTDGATANDLRFENVASILGIEWEMAPRWSDTVEALKNGAVCICLVNQETIFTGIGHFLVLTGITADGKILVNDPNGNNYKRFGDLYANGVPQYEFLKGLSGTWVFYKNGKPGTETTKTTA